MVSRNSLPSAFFVIGLGALLSTACTEISESPLSPESQQSAAAVDLATLTVPIQVSPAMLVLAGPGVWLTVHADVAFSLVDASSLTVNGVPSASAFADDRGDLVVKVYQADIEPLVAPPAATIVLDGKLKDETAFTGVEQIRVKLSAR